jgi:Uma2 family endonuclease
MSTALNQQVAQRAPRCLWFCQFTVAEYHEMIRHAIVKEDDNVELLNGWVVKKMGHNPPHDATVTRSHRCLGRLLTQDWIIRVQCAVTTKDSEPEPDIVVAAGPEETYYQRHPGPDDAFLLIEVADSSLEEDRTVKGPLYARAKFPVYWIVNLQQQQIEVYTQPRGGKSPVYKHRQDYGLDDTIPLVLGAQMIAHIPVRDLIAVLEVEP